MKRYTVLVLLIILALHFVYRVYMFRDEYVVPFNGEYWENRYLESQWVVSGSSDPIGDDGLYTYLGWELVHGANPALINAEMPPLGKYLIGWSILVFNNQNYFALFSGLLVLISLYLFAKVAMDSSYLSIFVVALFSFEPLFWQQLHAPLLDLLYLAVLLLTFTFLLHKRYLLAAVFLGFMMSTKSALATFVLVQMTFVLYFLFKRNWYGLKKWILSSIIALVVFIISYFRFFWLGNSFLDFLKVQKWIINFYSIGAKAQLGSVWLMLASGKWLTWWNGVQHVPEWWIGWTALLVLFVGYLVRLVKEREFKHVPLVAIWLLIYLFFLTFIPVWPRYLLLVLPFLYIVAFIVLKELLAKRSS